MHQRISFVALASPVSGDRGFLSNFRQGILQRSVLGSGHGSHFAGDPGSHQIGDFIHQVQRCAVQIFMDEPGRECVSGTYGVGHMHFKSRMLDRVLCGNQQTSAPSPRDGDQFQLLLVNEAARRSELVSMRHSA